MCGSYSCGGTARNWGEIFRNLSGKSGRAQSRGNVWMVDGYLRVCANLHRGLGGRPITFLPPPCARLGLPERVHGMRTRWCASVHDGRTHAVHWTITNEERGDVRCKNEEGKMRAAARGDAMRNDDILLEHTRGQWTNEGERVAWYDRPYLSWKILFVFLHISSLFYFCW